MNSATRLQHHLTIVEVENTLLLKSLEMSRGSADRIRVLEEEKAALLLALRMAKGNNVLLYITGIRYFTYMLLCILHDNIYKYFYNIYISLSKLYYIMYASVIHAYQLNYQIVGTCSK